VAAWTRSKKRLPNLERLLQKLGRPRIAKRSTKQLLAMAEKLNALFGGKDLRKSSRRPGKQKGES
jgi:hypothetical protein